MTIGLVPEARSIATGLTDPREVVETFLYALSKNDVPTAAALIDDDMKWVNVGLPTIKGKRRVLQIFASMAKAGECFEVYLHKVGTDGNSVLTERTDVLKFGPLRLQFWVWGRFDVVDGRITLWRDSFDTVDFLRSIVRGLVGVVIPGLRPKPPASSATAPGRH
jgi:limonene-1,2-epoxide hydrolase